jgi:hypothetical protein
MKLVNKSLFNYLISETKKEADFLLKQLENKDSYINSLKKELYCIAGYDKEKHRVCLEFPKKVEKQDLEQVIINIREEMN